MAKIEARKIVRHQRVALAAGIVAAEAFFLIAAYGTGEGGAVGHAPSQGICEFLGGDTQLCVAIPAVLTIALVVSIAPLAWMFATRRIDYRQIASVVETSPQSAGFLALHFLGFAGLSAPWLFDGINLRAAAIPHHWGFSASSATLAVCGFALWVAGPKKLAAVIAPFGLLLLIAPLFVILISIQIESEVWLLEWVRALTFKSVEILLIFLGHDIHYYSIDDSILGIGAFKVEIQNACSGLSGILLVTSVTLLYVIASRRVLRLDRAILIFPLAIFSSWALNIIRISVLLLIGEYVSPDLAVSAFHSYAGWVIFTLLSAAILVFVESLRWFHKDDGPQVPKNVPFFSDQVSAEILPFAVFMFSGVLVAASYQNAESGYFITFVFTLVCASLFIRVYKHIPFSSEKLPSVLGGLFVAGIWLSLNVHGEPLPVGEILATTTPVIVILWCAVRVLGTTLLVPLVEEMFFRSYLLRRLGFGLRHGKLVSLALSSIAFALLHGDILVAFLAGLVFGTLVLRSDKVGDAILAHVIANGLIATCALSFDDWSVI